MDVSRASFQSQESLDAVYGDMAASSEPVTAAIGRQMVELLFALPRVTPHVRIWGFTSLTRLWLIAEDRPAGEPVLGIQALPTGGYKFYRAVGGSYFGAEAVHTSDTVLAACSFLSTAASATTRSEGDAG